MTSSIFSMTGFGTGVGEDESVRVRATIRSVNGRHLDVQVRCPQVLQTLEPAIRERVQARAHRGKVSVALEWEELSTARGVPTLDADVAQQYLAELERLAELSGSGERPDLSVLTRLPGLFTTESPAVDLERAAELSMQALDEAAEDFEASRLAEGAALERDLRERLNLVEQYVDRIAEMVQASKERVRTRLREKVEALLEPGKIDEDRLAMEVVMVAEKSDITEEIVRLRSHDTQFIATLDKGGEVGRRLNFLLQEMNREANTMSSKTTEAEIVHQVVEVKEEIERLREQIQNLA